LDPLHELTVHPDDETERARFEAVLQQFLAAESDKPEADSTSVFARYDAPTGRWTLSFETQAARDAFAARWSAKQDRRSRRRA
jgi:hypothetical protein